MVYILYVYLVVIVFFYDFMVNWVLIFLVVLYWGKLGFYLLDMSLR